MNRSVRHVRLGLRLNATRRAPLRRLRQGRHWALLLPMAVSLLPADTPAQEPTRSAQDLLAYGARVRFITESGRDDWRSGLVARVNDCLIVLDFPEGRVSQAPQVPYSTMKRLQVSDRYDGRPGPDGVLRIYSPGSDTDGETWTDVSVKALREAYGGCDPP